MSVMACARRGCPNVLCEHLILDSRAYICTDCWEELLRVKATWPSDTQVEAVEGLIRDFLDTRPPEAASYLSEAVETEFRRLT